MVRTTVIGLLLLLAMSPAADARNCKKGQPCGNACISWKSVCRVGSATPARALSAPPAAAPASRASSTASPSSKIPAAAGAALIGGGALAAGASGKGAQAAESSATYAEPSTAATVSGRLRPDEAIKIHATEGETWVRITPATVKPAQWIQRQYLPAR